LALGSSNYLLWCETRWRNTMNRGHDWTPRHASHLIVASRMVCVGHGRDRDVVAVGPATNPSARIRLSVAGASATQVLDRGSALRRARRQYKTKSQRRTGRVVRDTGRRRTDYRQEPAWVYGGVDQAG